MRVKVTKYPELGVGEVQSEQDGKSTVKFSSGRVVVFPSTELEATVQKQPRIMWHDKSTGERFSARQDFIDKLPSILKTGKNNATPVRTLLELLGCDYSNDKDGRAFANDSRQLRDAKEYLVAEEGLPIVSIQAQIGGYYIADSADDLLENASAFRAQASGLVRSAESLEAVAAKLSTEVKNVATSV